MHKYISLLPSEYRQKMADEGKQKRILVISLAAAGVFATGLAVSIGIQLFLNLQVSSIEAQNEQISTQVAAYVRLEGLQQELHDLEAKVNGAKGLDPGWLSALYVFTNSLPQGIVMESVSCVSNGGTARIVTMELYGAVYSDISSTIRALEATGIIESANCTTSSVSYGDTSNNGIMRFTLELKLPDMPGALPAELPPA